MVNSTDAITPKNRTPIITKSNLLSIFLIEFESFIFL